MKLNPADKDFETALTEACSDIKVITECDQYQCDPRNRYVGQDGLVVAPLSTKDISNIINICHQWKVPVVPYGGGTGLVGGQLPVGLPRPVILTLERLNHIKGINFDHSLITVEAGCSLQQVQTAADSYNRLFPLSLASKGSCQIGGNLATNAGGANVVRYGNARDLCLGVEAVFADGSIWNGLSGLYKDNQGYDLRNLLIGSEGTLAIITAACLKLFPKLVDRTVVLASVPNPAASLQLFELTKQKFGQMVTAFELISKVGIDFLLETEPAFRSPFVTTPNWFVLADIGAESEFGIEECFVELLEYAQKNSLVSDALFAHSETQKQQFWNTRESIPLANRRIGSISSHDISLPLESIPVFIDNCGLKINQLGSFRINCFGHLGDGNLHYNVFPPVGEDRNKYTHYQQEVCETVYATVRELGGSTAAEHGTGRRLVRELSTYADSAYMQAVNAIKSSLDPNGILNPGVIIEMH